jgi:glycosyltransferase involved in cell wall biosynthesis
MNVVIVDGDVSYPPTSGKRLRTLNLMLRLASRHRITYIARSNGNVAEARIAEEFLGDQGIETLVVDEPVPHKAGAAFYARLAANLFSPVPYSASTHDTPRMRQAVRRYAEANPVDLWQFEWTPYVAALGHRRDARKLVIAHNVDSTIWQRYYETEQEPLKRWYMKKQWRKFESYERRVFYEATRIVTVSAEDAAVVRDRFGCSRVDVVENGIDHHYFGSVSGTRDPRRILFLGALDWRPNLDAIGVLLDRIYPAVRACEPQASLLIVGRSPPKWLVDRVRGLTGVALHANVPDVRPYLAESGMLAVPLRIGGGSRLKILEALASGLPVVSTRVGAEGLRLEAGKHLVVVPCVEEMTAAILDCMLHPGRAATMAEAGRQWVLEQYNWDYLALELERAWDKCLGVPAPARAHAKLAKAAS